MPWKRDDFPKNVQQILAQRAGFKCSAPHCRASTVGPGADPGRSVSVGVAAHITAAAPGGPRFDDTLSPEHRRQIMNGIWLCQTHAREIDVNPGHYPAEMLRHWRDEIESEARKAIGKPEHHVAQTNVSRARDGLRRAARAPDLLMDLVETILSLPNATIENIYPGYENERGRTEAVRRHSQAIREIRRDAEDALLVMGSPPALVDQVKSLFEAEIALRAQIQSARVPRESGITALPLWAQLEEIAGEIRRAVT